MYRLLPDALGVNEEYSGLPDEHKEEDGLYMSETDPSAKQEPKPLVRLTGENGCVIYPKMIPDGKGGWKMADPAAVARMLGTPEPPALENQ